MYFRYYANMLYKQPVSTVLVFILSQQTSKTRNASAQAHSDRTASVIPCEQLVFPTPNERETTASNRLLSHRECTSSSRPTWYIWCQFHLSIYFSLEAFVQKKTNFSPKALTKKRSIPSSKYKAILQLCAQLPGHECKRGWRWPCFDADLSAFLM